MPRSAQRVMADDQATLAQIKRDMASKRLDIAKADYKLAKEICEDKTGNDKDVCKKQAEEHYVAAKADAKARLKSKKAWEDAAEAKNDAAYKTEREKCDALAGEAKDVCVASVKAKFGR